MNHLIDFQKCWYIVILKDNSFHLNLQIKLFMCHHFSPEIPKSTSSHQNAPCFCHYIADKLLTWCWATFTHSLLTLAVGSIIKLLACLQYVHIITNISELDYHVWKNSWYNNPMSDINEKHQLNYYWIFSYKYTHWSS